MPSGSLLLWPFTSPAQVAEWKQSYLAGGHQPWHLSACETASDFIRVVLGFTDVTEVADCQVIGGDAWVTLGYPGERGVIPAGTAIHLLRLGSDPGGWVVVGSRDRPSLTFSNPRYGAVVGDTVHLAGHVEGLGEDMLSVRVLDRSGHTLGQAPRRLVSAVTAWSADVRLPAQSDEILIVVAATDSGVGSLGDLAITGVRRE